MFNRQVFKNTVLLIIELAGDGGIGSVKLNKCLIMNDALHKAFYGSSLTGATYVKHKYGPVPGKEAYDIIQKLITSGDIEVFDEMVSPGKYEKNHYLYPGLEVSKESFSDDEMNIISWVVSLIMPMTAQEISDISHDRCYHNTPMFHEIDLDNLYKWKISDNLAITNNMAEEVQKIDFDELNNFIHHSQATAN